MDSEYKLYLERSRNELNLSRIILQLSIEKTIQTKIFKIEEDTYFSSTISHAYYSIFYGAKAYLLTKGIKTTVPGEHKHTFEEFKKIIEKGMIDFELLKIYEELLIQADTLLHIFKHEKNKRGKFTYKKLPQANLEPAKESLNNAIKFFKHINNLCNA